MAEHFNIPSAEQRGGRLEHIATAASTIGLTALMALRSAGGRVADNLNATAQKRAEAWFVETGYSPPPAMEVARTDDGKEAIKNAENVVFAAAARVALKAYGGGVTSFIERAPIGTSLDPVERRQLIAGWNALYPDHVIEE